MSDDTSRALRATLAVAEQIDDLLPGPPHIAIYTNTSRSELHLFRVPIGRSVAALHQIAERLGVALVRIDYSHPDSGASVGWTVTKFVDDVRVVVSSSHFPPVDAGDGEFWAIDPEGRRHRVGPGALPLDSWHWVTDLDAQPEHAEAVTR